MPTGWLLWSRSYFDYRRIPHTDPTWGLYLITFVSPVGHCGFSVAMGFLW